MTAQAPDPAPAEVPFDFRLDRHILQTAPLEPAAWRPLDLPAGLPVAIADDGTDLPQQLAGVLAARGVEALLVDPREDTDRLTSLAGLVLMLPPDADTRQVIDAFTLMQRLGPALKETASRHGAALLASITRLDGQFGLGGGPIAAPVTESLAGMVKTASLEWPGITCRVLDIADAVPAERIIDQLLYTGPLEVGLTPHGEVETRLAGESLDTAFSGHPPLTPEDTVIITGGARGVTAEVAVALARVYQCRLLLVGRSPLPEGEPDWLHPLKAEADIKKAIVTHAGERLTLRDVRARFEKIMANRQIQETLERIGHAGGHASYAAADVRDAAAIAKVFEAARQEGPVAGIIHGAGILADRLIEDKTAEQFDRVFGTKVEGFLNLMRAAADDPLKVIVLFSSSTARLGRKGQIDYAAANDTLNKLAQEQKFLRPGCRVLSVNWGPWDGGMVSPELKKLFAAEGIEVIPLTDGANYLTRELDTPATGPVEIVILGHGSDLAKSMPASSTLLARTEAPHSPQAAAPPLVLEQIVSAREVPVLKDHVMHGKAVLPAALMIELITHAALAANPGHALAGVEHFSVFKGVVLEEPDELTLRVHAGTALAHGNGLSTVAELRSPASGKRLNARATVLLSRGETSPAPSDLPRPQKEYPLAADEIYAEPGLLFHGPQLYAIQGVEACDERGIIGRLAAAPPPDQWFRKPAHAGWLTDPLIIDGVFQLMILWTQQQLKMPSLPTHIERYEQVAERLPAEGVTCICRITGQTAHQVTADVELLDASGRRVARMTGYRSIADASLREAFLDNQLKQKGPA